MHEKYENEMKNKPRHVEHDPSFVRYKNSIKTLIMERSAYK